MSGMPVPPNVEAFRFADKIGSLFSSRRFYAAISGFAVTLLQSKLGLDPATAQSIVGLLMAWIVGDSIAKTK